jgi:hypothetical protein
MVTIKQILEDIPEEMQKAMFEELKSKFEDKKPPVRKPTQKEIDEVLNHIR